MEDRQVDEPPKEREPGYQCRIEYAPNGRVTNFSLTKPGKSFRPEELREAIAQALEDPQGLTTTIVTKQQGQTQNTETQVNFKLNPEESGQRKLSIFDTEGNEIGYMSYEPVGPDHPRTAHQIRIYYQKDDLGNTYQHRYEGAGVMKTGLGLLSESLLSSGKYDCIHAHTTTSNEALVNLLLRTPAISESGFFTANFTPDNIAYHEIQLNINTVTNNLPIPYKAPNY